jgi:hypothetical protein
MLDGEVHGRLTHERIAGLLDEARGGA